MKNVFLALVLASPALSFGQALPTYVPPASKVGGALAQGVIQDLLRRGFAVNDPRVIATVESIGARVIPLVAGAGAGSSWLGVAARMSPLVLAGVAIGGGLMWYFNADGTVTTNQTATNAPVGTIPTSGSVAYLFHTGSYGWGQEYVFQSGTPGVYIHLLKLRCTTYIAANCLTEAPNNYGTQGWPSSSFYNDFSATQNKYQFTFMKQNADLCPSGKILGADGSCGAGANTALPLDAALQALPQAVRVAPASPDLLAELTNRHWREAASQPGYAGLPYNSVDPVTAADMAAVRDARPADWPVTSDLGAAVPTSPVPIQSPWSNPNQVAPPAAATKVDLGPDPGVPPPSVPAVSMDFFAPVRALLAPWAGWTVPTHSAACPTWSASPSISGRVFQIDVSGHCDFVEAYRAQILAAAMACWTIAALFIILAA